MQGVERAARDWLYSSYTLSLNMPNVCFAALKDAHPCQFEDFRLGTFSDGRLLDASSSRGLDVLFAESRIKAKYGCR
jgi:hypothetical protein